MDLTDSQLTLLEQGEIISCELTPVSSNYTFLVELRLDGDSGMVFINPVREKYPFGISHQAHFINANVQLIC